jgi:hypothetical protein
MEFYPNEVIIVWTLYLIKRVIPQNFLFVLAKAGTKRKFMRNLIWFSIGKGPNQIPHKFPFVRFASEKEILRNDGCFKVFLEPPLLSY